MELQTAMHQKPTLGVNAVSPTHPFSLLVSSSPRQDPESYSPLYSKAQHSLTDRE